MIKTGVPVYLRSAPRNTGIVTRTSADGFRVTWHDPERKRGRPRLRLSYPWHMQERFVAGRPVADE